MSGGLFGGLFGGGLFGDGLFGGLFGGGLFGGLFILFGELLFDCCLIVFDCVIFCILFEMKLLK